MQTKGRIKSQLREKKGSLEGKKTAEKHNENSPHIEVIDLPWQHNNINVEYEKSIISLCL